MSSEFSFGRDRKLSPQWVVRSRHSAIGPASNSTNGFRNSTCRSPAARRRALAGSWMAATRSRTSARPSGTAAPQCPRRPGLDDPLMVIEYDGVCTTGLPRDLLLKQHRLDGRILLKCPMASVRRTTRESAPGAQSHRRVAGRDCACPRRQKRFLPAVCSLALEPSPRGATCGSKSRQARSQRSKQPRL